MTGIGSELPGITRRRLSLECYDAEQNHDKVYHLVIQEVEEDRFDVYAFWGRRGATLQSQKKTKRPTARYAADSLVDNFFNEKARKGYKVFDDVHFRTSDSPSVSFEPEALDTVEPEPVNAQWTIRDFVRNSVQPKRASGDIESKSKLAGNCTMVMVQGSRMLVYVDEAGALEAFNATGAKVTMPAPMREDLIDLEGPLALDGVWTGSEYVVFDAPAPETEYQNRYQRLFELLDGTVGERVRIADVAFSEAEKQQMVAAAREHNELGVWVRDGKVDNHPGQSDEHWLQFNFAPHALVVVMSLNGKCELGVDDGLGMIKVAELPGTDVHAEVGDVVEIEYEEWAGHGKLMQAPRIIGPRKDVPPERCDIEQLAIN